METIFHEKQEGSLCAQHCLNALLQGPYFTPVDLATLGQQMDDEERMRMAESGVDSDDYRRFLEQPSGNMDDSGYFSVQVINSALDVWGLELIPYNSTEPRAVLAQQNPTEMKAYICNYRDHWFTIRRLGQQWFNLNSLLSGPELISNTYLAMFLAQLQQEGYSIFVVFGNLPECTADEVLRRNPVMINPRPRIVEEDGDLQRALQLSLTGESMQSSDIDPELEQALRLSVGQTLTPTRSGDNDLEKALQLSLERMQELNVEEEEDQELQKALRLSLNERNSPLVRNTVETVNVETSDSSDSELEAAIRLSLASPTATVPSIDEVNVAEIRQRRLAYLENTLRPQQAGGGLHLQQHYK